MIGRKRSDGKRIALADRWIGAARVFLLHFSPAGVEINRDGGIHLLVPGKRSRFSRPSPRHTWECLARPWAFAPPIPRVRAAARAKLN